MAGKEQVQPEYDEYGLTFKDWLDVQGGKPKVDKQGQLTVITHDYPGGNGMVVTSHKSVEEYGTVNITLGKFMKRTRSFPIALLRQFHGEPCERESLKNGGEGYDRFRKRRK